MKFRVTLLAVCLALVAQPALAGDKNKDKDKVSMHEKSGMQDKAVSQSLDKLRMQYAEALEKGDAEKVSWLYSEDAVVLPPNEPAVEGRQKIKERYAKTLNEFTEKIEFHPQESKVSGDWGFDRGNVTIWMTPKSGGSPMTVNGKYVAILKKEMDGSWKLSRVIYNENTPPNQMTNKAE